MALITVQKSAQQRYLEKVVRIVRCACGCGQRVEVKKHQTFASYIKRAGKKRFVRGHQSMPVDPGLAQRGKFAEKAAHWKGGRGSPRKDGYVTVYDPLTRKHVLEHRYKMEKKLGRKLSTSEHVHHKKQGSKADNRYSNLQLLTASEHGKLHYEACPKTGRIVKK
jgi:hypothetical protein